MAIFNSYVKLPEGKHQENGGEWCIRGKKMALKSICHGYTIDLNAQKKSVSSYVRLPEGTAKHVGDVDQRVHQPHQLSAVGVLLGLGYLNLGIFIAHDGSMVLVYVLT